MHPGKSDTQHIIPVVALVALLSLLYLYTHTRARAGSIRFSPINIFVNVSAGKVTNNSPNESDLLSKFPFS